MTRTLRAILLLPAGRAAATDHPAQEVTSRPIVVALAIRYGCPEQAA